MIRLRAQIIDGASDQPFCYGSLSHTDIHTNEVEPHSFHCIHYRRVIPLSACPEFFRHPCDPLRRLVVETLQKLDQPPGHHPDLAAVQEHRLRHHLINISPGPHCCFCPLHQPQYHYPPYPIFPQVLV